MAFGSSAFGSSAFGGSQGSTEQVFLPLALYAPDVLHESEVSFTGSASRYQIVVRQGSENPTGPNGVEYKVYSSNDPGETPQLQVTLGGVGSTIIGAASRILVTALVDGVEWSGGMPLQVVGRPYPGS